MASASKKRLPPKLGAVIEFTAGDEAGRKVPLHFERTILGRKSADILVRDLGVSGSHLAIEFRGGFFKVVDLGSSNGTFVEGKKVKERAIQPGQEVRLGNSVFHLTLDPYEAARLLEDSAPPADTKRSGLTDLIDREFFQSEEDRTERSRIGRDSAGPTIHLRIVAGPDSVKSFEFPQATILIGRLNADLSLADPGVSRKHAVLERGEGGQVILRDLASANGTFVNSRPVTNCVLSPRDQIKVGKTTIVFVGVEG